MIFFTYPGLLGRSICNF